MDLSCSNPCTWGEPFPPDDLLQDHYTPSTACLTCLRLRSVGTSSNDNGADDSGPDGPNKPSMKRNQTVTGHFGTADFRSRQFKALLDVCGLEWWNVSSALTSQ